MMPTPVCDEGNVRIVTRMASRCYLERGCVHPGMCPMYMPACAEGYTLTTWSAPPRGCNAFACDPSFLFESAQ
jgi:hypothetical protein